MSPKMRFATEDAATKVAATTARLAGVVGIAKQRGSDMMRGKKHEMLIGRDVRNSP